MHPKTPHALVASVAAAALILLLALAWDRDPSPQPDSQTESAQPAQQFAAGEIADGTPSDASGPNGDGTDPETTIAVMADEPEDAGFDASPEIETDETAGDLGSDVLGGDELPAPDEPAPVQAAAVLTKLAELQGPLVMALPDPWSAERVYAVEQSGMIVALDLASGDRFPFLDLRRSVLAEGESGLHAFLFHPVHPGRAFVFYNDLEGGLVLDEVSIDRDHDLAEIASTRLRIPPAYGAHNGGALAFGPDGMLYVSVGDGGQQGDPDNRAQDLESLHGKILRIDVDGSREAYAVPASNPFAHGGGRPEIWLYGFRNPWRMAFDGEGNLWIADVGGSIAEEVDLHRHDSPAGRNFGWRVFEGAYRHYLTPIADVVMPIHDYPPSNGRCAIVGGFVYDGPSAALAGSYLFADFCDGKVRALAPDEDGSWHARDIVTVGKPLVHLAALRDGSVLVVGYGGALWRYGAP